MAGDGSHRLRDSNRWMRMSIHKGKEAASALLLGALFLRKGGVSTSEAFAWCLMSKSQDKC